jgi:excisionase family DNA binding protein
MSRVTVKPARGPYQPAPQRLLSLHEASDYLGLSPNTMRKYRDQGRIKARIVGDKMWKFHPDNLDAFVNARADEAPTSIGA